MKHIKPLLMTLILLLMLTNTEYTRSENTQLEVSKSTVFKYTIDMFNNTISCKCNVKISVKNNLNREVNVIIITLERPHGSAINIVEGEQPHNIIKRDDFTILIWNTVIKEKSYWRVSIEYLPNTSIPIEIGLKMHYKGSSTVRLDKDKYLLTGVKAKGVVLLHLSLVNTREEYTITSYGERVVLPLIATISLSHPKDLCMAISNKPEANYTRLQSDFRVHSWMIVLQHQAEIRQEIFIKKLSAWQSLWLPPISIDLVDDPWSIRARLKATEIEKMYENLKNTLNETTNTYEKMREIKSRLEALERGLSKSLGEYEKALDDFMSMIEDFEKKIKDAERSIEYYYKIVKPQITSIEGRLEDLIDTLELIEDITSDLNVTSGGISEAIELARSLQSILSDVEQAFERGAEYIESNLDTVKNLLYTSKNAVKSLLNALEAMEGIVSDMVIMIDMEMDKMRERLSDLKRELAKIEKQYEKYTLLMDITERKIREYMNSINVTSSVEELEVSKKISVRYNIGIKLPLLVSEIKTIEHTTTEVSSEEKASTYLNLLILLLLIGIASPLFYRRLTRTRRSERRCPEVEELLRRIEKVESFIKKKKEK